jgi:hypothetical protein
MKEFVRWSASQVDTFQGCNRKWWFNKILGLEIPQHPSAAIGSAVHAELEGYLTGEHGIDNSTIDIESTGSKPSTVIRGIVHNLVGRGCENITDPTLNKALIKIAATSMSNRVVSAPTLHSNSVASNETIVARPSGAKRFHVRITGFEVNCNLLCSR